jgi:hypothetical protein
MKRCALAGFYFFLIAGAYGQLSGCTTYADNPPAMSTEEPLNTVLPDHIEADPERDFYHQSLLREDMRAMTISVRKLLVLDSQKEVSAKDRHRQVMRELDNLEGIARIIDEDEELVGYSLSRPYLGAFLHDVSMAREFALQDPPDYQPATWLIKSCLFCHKNI